MTSNDENGAPLFKSVLTPQGWAIVPNRPLPTNSENERARLALNQIEIARRAP